MVGDERWAVVDYNLRLGIQVGIDEGRHEARRESGAQNRVTVAEEGL